MKNFNFISLFILASVVSSCGIDPCGSSDGDVVDIYVYISVRSEEGIDLLNPDNPDSFTRPDIGFFYMNDGQLIEFPHSRVDISEHPEYGYLLSAGPGDTPEEFTVDYIQWKSDLDTLKSQVVRRHCGSYESVHKVWYNGELVWNQGEDKGLRYFTIIK